MRGPLAAADPALGGETGAVAGSAGERDGTLLAHVTAEVGRAVRAWTEELLAATTTATAATTTTTTGPTLDT
ncbi:hypothetical protein GCM10010145_12550 [Streptomyces ruber]|uniref:Uncharacterized protein n=2 Tax=Streptomyces TaxID=1883 RepID=A0A918BBY6_9ACTN|nr:hypothetical protein [Streptomyces ruber]GGQ45354.1 hypothetical protein GCM10010145_12550 [Streptomyces ruber]